jgi:hypothetical protein
MIEHDAVDRTEAASKLERVEQLLIAGHGNFDAIRRDRSYASVQRQAVGAMADKVEKALDPKSSVKNESGDLVHRLIRTTDTARQPRHAMPEISRASPQNL